MLSEELFIKLRDKTGHRSTEDSNVVRLQNSERPF